ncbi:MAG: DNA polymerase III subunit gamma/tau [Anaerococcus sp.]|uniref:DNA polymerase III subunit gamma/tau n=1 Tax=Anaerococcus sp. TaxID=1872515 RepID=UPI002626BE76|nr:DNA polymerase III subunit gamma/tau [Anaerococcus sp.]MCI5972837.1 DNA polymerase III subunit gamma/tau [Anaerococcus sp.]MDD6918255.1 DNA polymerase III subunit gamma/tau [Peptoniphilaceae bacterium]
MAKALYRQYRPKTFDEVLGQDRVVNVLKNQVKNNNFSHAYIFAGERGCGKTTCAKIFAKAINCLHPVDGSPCLECENCKAIDDESTIDIIEMDAASNRRIDDIRNLKDNVIYPPNKLKYKVYIIDEAHMITREAFNALLKIMEEPPSHLVFILATTEIDKIPNTILSRAQNFEFNKIEKSKIKEQISIILKDKDIEMENEAIDLIIRKAKGAMRDALSILDQVLSYDTKSYKLADVENLLGVVDFYDIDKLTKSIFSFNQKQALSYIFSLRENNKSNKDIIDSIINYFRDIMVYKMSENPDLFDNEERFDFIKKRAGEIEIDRLLDLLDILNEYSSKLKSSDNTDLIVELMTIRLISSKDIKSLDSRIRSLESGNEKDLIGLINKLVDDKISKLDLSKYENINTNETFKVKDASIDKENKTDKIEVEDEISEGNTLSASSLARSEDSRINDDLEELSQNVNGTRSIDIPTKMADDIRDMIIKTAGRMLKPMFEKDGFNYSYRPGEFVLYLKDDFYGIFIQTKTDDIVKELNEILKDEVIFSVDNYSKFTENKVENTEIEKSENYEKEEKKTKKSEKLDEINDDSNINQSLVNKEDVNKNLSNIDRLKEIFKEELIIK